MRPLRIFTGAIGDPHMKPEVLEDRADDQTVGARRAAHAVHRQPARQRVEHTPRISVSDERAGEDAGDDAERRRMASCARLVVALE
jgi:hypothetical protein